MAINLDDSVLAMWAVELRSGEMKGNWMALLSKDEAQGYLLQFRFRWYRDEKVSDSEDQRTFYTARFNPKITTDAQAIAHARAAYEHTRCDQPGGWELIRGARSMEEFTDALAEMPGIHVSKITNEEAEKMGLTD